MFVALLKEGNTRVEATEALRESVHLCTRCSGQVILARGKQRRAHFRHPKDSSCPYGVGETWQHEQAKAAILEGARARGLVAYPEQEVLSIDGDCRADVVVMAPQTALSKDEAKRRLAFEVQYSAISSENLTMRTNSYMAAGVPMLWIAVIDHSKLKSIHKVNEIDLFVVNEFPVPSWIEDIARRHKRLWIYIPQTNGFWRGWLEPHWRYKNPSDGYDSSGQYHSSGGYWFPAAKRRDLYLSGPHPFQSMLIVRRNHSDNPLISPNGEKKFLVELLPNGDETPLSCAVEQRICPHLVDGHDTGFYNYVEWHTIDGRDTRATFSVQSCLPSL